MFQSFENIDEEVSEFERKMFNAHKASRVKNLFNLFGLMKSLSYYCEACNRFYKNEWEASVHQEVKTKHETKYYRMSLEKKRRDLVHSPERRKAIKEKWKNIKSPYEKPDAFKRASSEDWDVVQEYYAEVKAHILGNMGYEVTDFPDFK